MGVRVLAGALVLGVALTACNGSEEGPAATLPPVTATPADVPEPTGVPTKAQEATPEGAGEFVRHFYAQLEDAYATSNPELVRPLVAPECGACQRIVSSLERLSREGLRVSGHAITVREAVAPTLPENATTASVTAVLSFSDYVEIDSSGTEVYREAAVEQVVQDVELRREGRGWVVTAVVES